MADADTEKAVSTTPAVALPAEPNGAGQGSSSDLDSILARLEEQEEKAEKDGEFLHHGGYSGVKPPSAPPAAVVVLTARLLPFELVALRT